MELRFTPEERNRIVLAKLSEHLRRPDVNFEMDLDAETGNLYIRGTDTAPPRVRGYIRECLRYVGLPEHEDIIYRNEDKRVVRRDTGFADLSSRKDPTCANIVIAPVSVERLTALGLKYPGHEVVLAKRERERPPYPGKSFAADVEQSRGGSRNIE